MNAYHMYEACTSILTKKSLQTWTADHRRCQMRRKRINHPRFTQQIMYTNRRSIPAGNQCIRERDSPGNFVSLPAASEARKPLSARMWYSLDCEQSLSQECTTSTARSTQEYRTSIEFSGDEQVCACTRAQRRLTRRRARTH